MNSNTIQATKLLTHYRCGRLPRPDEVHFGKIGEASTTQYKDNFQSEFQALSETDNGPQDLHPEWGVVDFPLSGRRRLDRREYSGDGKEGRITETVVSDRATFIEERTVGNAGYDNVQIIVKDGYERVHQSSLQGEYLMNRSWNDLPSRCGSIFSASESNDVDLYS